MFFFRVRQLWQAAAILTTILCASNSLQASVSSDIKKASLGYAHYAMGLIYDYYGQPEESAQEFKYASKFDKDSYFIHKKLGVSYTKLNKPEKAIEELKKASQLDPRDLETRFLLSLLYFQKLILFLIFYI